MLVGLMQTGKGEVASSPQCPPTQHQPAIQSATPQAHQPPAPDAPSTADIAILHSAGCNNHNQYEF